MSEAHVQIAFLTGRSNPANCALSPAQSAFLQRLGGPGRRLEPLNFPYRPTAAPYECVGLWQASLNNALDYLGSRSRTFRLRFRPAVQELLAGAPHTVLLAGSCGLELFVNLRLDSRCLERTTVIAFGPVARALPTCRCVLVQGRRDWISRLFMHDVQHIVAGHHLNYLAQEEVVQRCQSVVTEAERGSRTAGQRLP